MLTMPVTDDYGDTYPDAVWVVTQINIQPLERFGLLTFNAYEPDRIGRRVLAQRQVPVTPDGWDDYFADADPQALLAPCYRFAKRDDYFADAT